MNKSFIFFLNKNNVNLKKNQIITFILRCISNTVFSSCENFAIKTFNTIFEQKFSLYLKSDIM